MNDLSALFPPPFCVQRRGWEAAYALISEFIERLDPIERHVAGWIAARRPERLGWHDIGAALRLYRRLVEVRT